MSGILNKYKQCVYYHNALTAFMIVLRNFTKKQEIFILCSIVNFSIFEIFRVLFPVILDIA